MAPTPKNIKLLVIGAIGVVLVITAVVFVLPKRGGRPPALPAPQVEALPADLLSKDKAASIVKEIVQADAAKDDIAAYLYPEVLRPGDEVTPWGYDEERGGLDSVDRYSYLAWIDRDPGNAFFAHETEFILIDAKTGEYVKKVSNYWPVINDEVSFEGDTETMVAGEPTAVRGGTDYRAKMMSYVRTWSVPAAVASADNRPRITANPAYAPTGEYYALIVSGFGRNAWVFLDGAQAMYETLKNSGYDDGHITFLAPGPVKIDAGWDRKGEPQVIRQEGVVDQATSPANVEAAINAITSKMTEKDSLFVMVLAHGDNGWIDLGKPLPRPQEVGLIKAFKGLPASLSSKKFSAALLAKTKACEIMVVFDSCYSGSHQKPLQSQYDETRIKRLVAAHSTDDKTKSYGADYRKPADDKKKVKGSLDVKAAETPVADPNPADFGGEFSSGFIANLGKQVFAAVYEAGAALDAAKMNKMTKPFMWNLGKDGACLPPVVDTVVNPPPAPPSPPPTPPSAQPPTQPVKKISVIPYDGSYIPAEQVTQYTPQQCPCCDAPHWHAKSGTATTLDGRKITDPYAKCGLGKVSEHPVTTIEVPQ
jgi:hypothetical protein